MPQKENYTSTGRSRKALTILHTSREFTLASFHTRSKLIRGSQTQFATRSTCRSKSSRSSSPSSHSLRPASLQAVSASSGRGSQVAFSIIAASQKSFTPDFTESQSACARKWRVLLPLETLSTASCHHNLVPQTPHMSLGRCTATFRPPWPPRDMVGWTLPASWRAPPPLLASTRTQFPAKPHSG